MPPRIQQVTQVSLIADMQRRIHELEGIVTTRALPAGYQFTLDSTTGELLIRRLSDGATTTIL